MQSTYETMDAFYRDERYGEQRTRSREVDFGVWWRNGDQHWPRHRVTWVEATGELYAFKQAPTGGPEVAVLGVITDEAKIEEVLKGWAEECGAAYSLNWVSERMSAAGATAALT